MWDNGATTQTITQLESGYYTLTVFYGTCQVSEIVYVADSCTNIKEIADNGIGLKIFPNPANDNIYITTENNDLNKLIIKIINTQGQIVFEESNKKINGKYNRTIDISEFSEGVYYLQFISDKKTILKKLIIARK